MKKRLLALAVSAALAGEAHAFDLKGTIYEEAGLRYNIDPTLLYAIALVESAVDSSELGMVNPYPWALRTDKPFYGKTRREAEIELQRLLKAGRSVDWRPCARHRTSRRWTRLGRALPVNWPSSGPPTT